MTSIIRLISRCGSWLASHVSSQAKPSPARREGRNRNLEEPGDLAKELLFRRLKKNIRKLKCISRLQKNEKHCRKNSSRKQPKEDSKEEEKKHKQESLDPQHTIQQRDNFEKHKAGLEYSYLVCPVCMDLMVSATTTLCGHMFCERCIFEWNLFNKECPICRKPVRHEVPHPCPMMNTLIESYLQQPSMEKDRENFRARKQKHDVWKAGKAIHNTQPGIYLDVRDTEHIWCKGQILKAISYVSSPQVLLVHYDGWSSIYDEYIQSDSPRLAPEGFFTGRQDIPRYLLNGSGNCRFAYVVVGQEAANRLTERLMDLDREAYPGNDMMPEEGVGAGMDPEDEEGSGGESEGQNQNEQRTHEETQNNHAGPANHPNSN